MSISRFKTLNSISEGIYKEKGSKFIAIARHVESIDEVNSFLEEVKKKYHDARHHCYAYRLGFGGELYRANDDGEPSGSAGLPILGQLKSAEVTNSMVIVVRYFGGTKLGVSGLIRAYKTASRDAITNNEILEKTVMGYIQLVFDYSFMNEVMRFIKNHELDIIEQSFEMTCEMKISIPVSKIKNIEKKLKLIKGLGVNNLNKNDA